MNNDRMMLEYQIREYESLRDEIMETQKRNTDIMNYSIVGTSAILGYAFSVRMGFLFLVPLAILIPMSYMIRRNANTIILIASYISVMIEKKSDWLRWETFRYKLREHESKEKRASPRMLEYMMVYDFLLIVCLSLSFIYWDLPLFHFMLLAILPVAYFLWWNKAVSWRNSYRRQQRTIKKIEEIAEEMKRAH
jgi:Flp pilus assembly protein TadB